MHVLTDCYRHLSVCLDYKHGVRLTTNIDNKVLITFNARNEHDRTKFVEDLKEAILEVRKIPLYIVPIVIEFIMKAKKSGGDVINYRMFVIFVCR